MDNKILLQDLSNGVSQRSGLAKRESDNFVRTFFTIIEQYLQEDKIVKVKGLGTFKIVEVSGRDSVNINTGERFHIKGHSKITFTPDADLRDYVNRPFADFETIILNDGVDLSAMEYVAEDETPEDDEVTVSVADDTIEENVVEESSVEEVVADNGGELTKKTVADNNEDHEEVITDDAVVSDENTEEDTITSDTFVEETPVTEEVPVAEEVSVVEETPVAENPNDKVLDGENPIDGESAVGEQDDNVAETVDSGTDVSGNEEEVISDSNDDVNAEDTGHASVEPVCPVREELQSETGFSLGMETPHYVLSHTCCCGRENNSLDEAKKGNDCSRCVWKILCKVILVVLLMLFSYLIGYNHLFCGNDSVKQKEVPAKTANHDSKTASKSKTDDKSSQNKSNTDSNGEVKDSQTQGANPTASSDNNSSQASNVNNPATSKDADKKTDANNTSGGKKVRSVNKSRDAINVAVSQQNTVQKNTQQPVDDSLQSVSGVASNYPQVKGGAYEIVGVKCTHVLQKGETVSKLSRAYLGGVEMNDYIIKLNNLSSPDLMKVGQILKIPELRKK